MKKESQYIMISIKISKEACGHIKKGQEKCPGGSGGKLRPYFGWMMDDGLVKG